VFAPALPAAFVVVAGLTGFASADTLTAVPEQPLQALLDRARDGDVVELAPGDTMARSESIDLLC